MASEPTFLTLALMVVTLSVLVSLGKLLYFQLYFHYNIRSNMLSAAQNVAGWVNLDKSAIADTWDTQLVNLLEYLQRNEDSSERLAVLDEESEKYIQLHNFNTARNGYLLLMVILGVGGGILLLKQASLQPRTVASSLLQKMNGFWGAK